jgi:hypothetical protein
MQVNSVNRITDALRHMTVEQLLYLGTRQVVYLRSGTQDGQHAFMIYGADGTPLEVVDALDVAMQLVAENGLHFVTIH